MGATSFGQTRRGTSMREAFKSAVKEAHDEYGHQQGYSGQINCTELVADKTAEYKKAKDKDAFLAQLVNDVPKRDTWGVELEAPVGNKNKIKSVVEITPQKGARVWETRFNVLRITHTSDPDTIIAEEKTQGAAVKKARAHTEKTQETTRIEIEKVLVGGKNRVARITYKKSTTEAPGKYFFAVCAPE